MTEFRFTEQHFLIRHLGRRAWDLPSLAQLIEDAPDEAIFCHVHLARLRPTYQRSGLLNNFASWALTTLHEVKLAERLSVVDGASSPSIAEVRTRMVELVREHMGSVQHGPSCLRGHEFYLCAVEGDLVDTGVRANTVDELRAGIATVGRAALICHLHGATLRHPDGIDDFSRWLSAHGEATLAGRCHAVPRWTLTVDEVRDRLCAVLEGQR